MKTHDYFMVALAFLVSAIVMVMVVIFWLPRLGPLGQVASQTGGFIYLDRDWLLSILVLPPFSLFLGFLTVGLREYIFGPIHE